MATQTPTIDLEEVRERPWEHYLRHNLYLAPIAFLFGYIVFQLALAV